jgi:hypothetical protein
MKGNMKKLVVFVIIATIVTFISAAMAKDVKGKYGGKNHWKAIHGEYAATSVVSCNSYKPNPDPPGGFTFAGTSVSTQLAIYTFNGDGTGTLREGKFVMLGVTPTPSESAFDFQWDFTYEVADDGKITMDVVPGTDKFMIGDFRVFKYMSPIASESGWLSADRKTIIIGSETVDITGLEFLYGSDRSRNVRCNISRVLIRLGE